MTSCLLDAELHARTAAFRRKVSQAQNIIQGALDSMVCPYVAFSGGKDSSVVLHLVRAQAPDTPAVWSDDEWNLPETIKLIDQTPHCIRIASQVHHADWFVSWPDGPVNLPSGTIWIEDAHKGGLQTYARQRGYDGVFLGLRADENSRRRVHLRSLGTLYFAGNNQVWQCNPLAWWSVIDVWAYLRTYQAPYNAAYDKLSALGIPLERQRIGPLAVGRVLGYGQLALLKRGWPDLYNRFAARYPEARGDV